MENRKQQTQQLSYYIYIYNTRDIRSFLLFEKFCGKVFARAKETTLLVRAGSETNGRSAGIIELWPVINTGITSVSSWSRSNKRSVLRVAWKA